MKTQINRFSPHQTAKVMAILMAAGSLVSVVPVMLLASMFGGTGADAPSLFVVLLLPLFYLVFGYVSVAVGCLLYNFLRKYTGGIEIEFGDAAPETVSGR